MYKDNEILAKKLVIAFYLLCNIVLTMLLIINIYFPNEIFNIFYSSSTNYYKQQYKYYFLQDHSLVAILLALFLIIFSYIFFNFYCFNRMYSLLLKFCDSKNTASRRNKHNYFFLFLFVLSNQLAFAFFYLYTGYGKAGGNELTDNPLKYYFVAFPTDYILLCYYAIENNVWRSRINSLIYIISSFLRGWVGGIVIVGIIGALGRYRQGKLRRSHVYFIALLIAFISPFLISLKFYIRSSKELNLSIQKIGEVFYTTFTNLIDVILYFFYNVICRFQMTTALVDIMEHVDSLYFAFGRGVFRPFYDEGIIRILLRRSSAYQEGATLSSYLTYMGADNLRLDEASFTNPTIFGWLMFSDSIWIVGYIIYVIILMLVSMYLMQRLSSSARSMDVLWTVWIVLLTPGWFGPFQQFILSQIIVIVFTYIERQLRIKS